MDYRDRSRILFAMGVLLLIVGLGFALLAPSEFYSFYLFSDGGRFHYEGFGFGSFMFANIANQIIGYYLIAIVLIPLGYGQVRPRRWARTLALTLLGFWIVIGIPTGVLALLVLFSSKDVSPAGAALAIALSAISYLLVPGVLIWFYRSNDTRSTFEARDPNSYWVERVPVPVLVLGLLLAFYAVALHIPIFLNGLFPLFGAWIYGLHGIACLAVSVLLMLFLAWGLVRQRPWAWWGSLTLLTVLTVSSVLTLSRSSFSDILGAIHFPPTELALSSGIPIQGLHLTPFVGIPLLVTIALLLYSGRYFRAGRNG
ncbi:hypothetical protein ACFLWA_00220 [Chloroflexota bacterium]